MAEHEVSFCTTEDGVRIAYSVEGEGPPLVVTPFLMESFALEHLVPQWEQFFQLLKEDLQLVRYDMRGVGLSEPGAHDVSPAHLERDLGAVIQAAGLRHFALLAWGMYGPVAIAYTAKHQSEVQALALYCTYSRGLDVMSEKAGRSLAELARANWSLGARALADLSSRREFGEAGLALARWYRESTTGETCGRLLESWVETDVSDQLGQIRCPTLVVHPRDDRAWKPALGQQLAAAISDARLVTVAGGFHAVAFTRAEGMVKMIHDFMVETTHPKRRMRTANMAAPGGFATILFTDMEGSTTLANQHGDEVAQQVRRAHNDIVRSALAENNGSEIKHTGDGIMASFSTASSALESAIAIQRGVAEHKQEHPDSPLGVYIGLNAGEPIAEDDDLFGTAVDLAARLVDHAQPGQIIASDVVRQLAAGKDFLFADLGETELRGFEDPVKLWELRWQDGPA